MPDTAVDGGRRQRGEPRRLLIETARDLFNRWGYQATTTRVISEQAGVAESMIFRIFGSKAALFHEAVVQPFLDAIEAKFQRYAAPVHHEVGRDETREFVAAIYRTFREHRLLAAMIFAADALVESEVARSEAIEDIRVALDRFVDLASEHALRAGRAIEGHRHDLVIRGHMAMVAGVAAFGPWYLGVETLPEEDIIEELTTWIWLRYNPR